MAAKGAGGRINPAWQRHNRSLRIVNRNVFRWSRTLWPKLLKQRNTVFVAAMPKSGSTVLMNALTRASGYFPHRLCDHHLQEQNILESQLIDSLSFRSIAVSHTRASKVNVELLRKYGIRCVVLTRDIFDVAVSMRDHIKRESIWNSTFNAHPALLDAPPEAQLDAVIDLAAPWNLAFVSEWQRADIPKHFVRYEELVEDPPGVIAGILDFCGVDEPAQTPEAAWRAAVESGDTRMNVGKAGRGGDTFTPEQTERLKALRRHFPETDFSPIGL